MVMVAGSRLIMAVNMMLPPASACSAPAMNQFAESNLSSPHAGRSAACLL